MRDASECRARDPRTCYYHGAVITMNEAMERISRSNGNPNPADWDIVFNARKRVEEAEEELRKQRWLREAEGITEEVVDDVQSKPTSSQRRGSGSRQKKQETNNRSRYAKNKTSAARKPVRQPQVQATEPYNDNVFPPQVGLLSDEKGRQVVFTRHDQTSAVPDGLMLAGSRNLTPAEREHLIGLLKYQHTIATRDKDTKKVKTVAPEDILVDHSSRSVYMKTQFSRDGSELKGFHEELNKLIKEGSPPRRDGTRKFEPFSSDVKIALYYN